MDGHNHVGTAGGGLRMDITLGNIISWAVMIATMGVIYGTLSQTVSNNSRRNDRQDEFIVGLQEALTDVKVAIATGNGDLRLMRESIERIERVQQENRRQ